MRELRATIFLAIMITVTAVICIFFRIKWNSSKNEAIPDNIWRLTYQIELKNVYAKDKIHVTLPVSLPHARIFREQFEHSGLLVDIVRNKQNQTRNLIALVRKNGETIDFTAFFDIKLHEKVAYKTKTKITKEHLANYLKGNQNIQVKSSIVKKIIKKWKKDKVKQDQVLGQIIKHCAGLKPRQNARFTDAARTLAKKTGNKLGRARAMIALCRAYNIPARLVTGFLLKANKLSIPHHWVEIYQTDRWVAYDPLLGLHRNLPVFFIPAAYEKADIVQCKGKARWQSSFSMEIVKLSQADESPGDFSNVFDLTRMDSSFRQLLSTLLMMPLGALIIVIFRNIIGIKTFGTFGPVILALSFVYADWQTGLALLVSIIIIGIVGRTLLDKLKLLIISRLGILLTLVVLCVTTAISILDFLGLTPSARAVLLPVVIVTMLIERFHITTEEDGMAYAFKLLCGSIIAAFVCYQVFSWQRLGSVVLKYPESLLIVMALLMLIGRYTGYRLTELVRFHSIEEK